MVIQWVNRLPETPLAVLHFQIYSRARIGFNFLLDTFEMYM
jgi:hypothetical protein